MAKRVREVRLPVRCPGCGGVLVEDQGLGPVELGSAVRRVTLLCSVCGAGVAVTLTVRLLPERRPT